MKYRFRKITALLTAVMFSASALFTVPAYAEQSTYTAAQDVVSEYAESLPSSEELLLGYFEQKLMESDLFSCNEAVSYSALGSSRLSGTALEMYNAAKAQIENIAAGKEASAVIAFPTITFTYEELGLESGASSSDIQTAIANTAKKVYRYLLTDLPYELYWHDKGTGMKFGYGYTYDGTSVTFNNLAYSLYTGTEYSGSEDFTVDTSKTSAASAAAENAAKIVAENAGKTDVEKLTAYKEKICELVTYDHEAADSEPSEIGIDPWQIIHVFDGDDATNVVCEGYSKAFYYLCLLSDFSGYIDCWTVSGYMNGGAHMWNVVAIGSRNYLVDVTNCDEGSIGNPDNLFLKGVTGSVAGGYTITIGSTDIAYTYKSDTITLVGNEILKLSDLDYSEEIDDSDTYTGEDENDQPAEDDEDEGIVIWANGSKNYKSAELKSEITATNWLNAKGKTQKGKLVWTAMLTGTPTYDLTKHKVTTKSDKTVATVTSKGKITAKAGGTALVYATDTGALEHEAFKITVKNAPTAVFLFDDPDKTAADKKEKLKTVNVIAGGESSRIYIAPYAKQGEVSDDCTYTVTAKKNEGGIISFTDVKQDENGNFCFDVSGNKLLKAGKPTKISVTVTCDQSGKKTSVNVQVYAPLSGISCSSDVETPTVSKKGDILTLKTALEINGTSSTTTDKFQVVVSTSAPTVDSTGKKVTITKSKQITAKMDKTSYAVTLKAGKPVTEAAGVYFIATDAVTKKKIVYKAADIAADGTVTFA